MGTNRQGGSFEVILGNTQGRMIDPSRLRRLFRLRQLTRLVRQPGHIRLHHFRLSIDPGLWGQTVEVLIYPEDVGQHVGEILQQMKPICHLARAGNTRAPYVYAESGLWYDALTAISDLLAAAPNEPVLRQVRGSLLEQIGLREIAEHDMRRSRAP